MPKANPIVAFRTDASSHLGMGHLVRCLTLAEELLKRGASVHFFCRPLAGEQIELIKQKGALFHALKDVPESDWSLAFDREDMLERLATELPVLDALVVDHYRLDRSWEEPLRTRAPILMAIDDKADRSHDCDLLLDQNYYRDMSTRYQGFLPASCVRLIGPTYALLREEFTRARSEVKTREGINRILVFLGGSDPANVTASALSALSAYKAEAASPRLAIEVVVGPMSPHFDNISLQSEQLGQTRVHRGTREMAHLMLHSDLSIGAGGTTTWERCSMGLPSLVLAVADNQERTSADLNELGIHRYLGTASEATTERIREGLLALNKSPRELREMSEKSAQLVDAAGTLRVADALWKAL